MNKPILDMTAGSRMFWWDKHNPLAVFLDKRRETFTLKYPDLADREVSVDPDVLCDWAKERLPYPDNTFALVVFDPPHLLQAGKGSWLARKYGVLEKTWPEDLKHGMDEAMRVVKPEGTVIFKWNDEQIKLAEVLKAIGRNPLFGDKRSKTHWLVFMKEVRDERD